MILDSANGSPIWLRLAVVVGGCSLVLGLVGIVMLVVRDDSTRPAWGPGLGARLLLRGVDDAEPTDLRVDVSWPEEDGQIVVRQTALPRSKSPGSFLLPPGAVDRAVTLEVFDARVDPPRLLGRHEVTVKRGEEVALDVALPDAPR